MRDAAQDCAMAQRRRDAREALRKMLPPPAAPCRMLAA